ncbi:MAG: GIY-YIG nuclease family protein, partial [Kiritimatiellia bacterium]
CEGGLLLNAPRLRLGVPSSPEYHYVYILVSESDPTRHYTGCTTNLLERLTRHNQGRNPHTSKYTPWRIETAIRFSNPDKAHAFERYLKSGSGREFARRHF